MSKHLKEKQEIARKATVLFEGKNTIVADSSTTVVEALKLLPNSTDITVVTNSTEIFREFQQSAINFISTGGDIIRNHVLYRDNLQRQILRSTM